MTSEIRERMIRYPARKVNLGTELGVSTNPASPRRSFAQSPRQMELLAEINEEIGLRGPKVLSA